jgi:hypothetical protein
MTIQSNVDFEFLETPDGMVVVTDPDMGQLAETEYDLVEGSGTTGGPNRYTLHVPYDSTTMSLGKESPTRINDRGFTVRTDEHMHLHVRNGTKTIVSLGSKAQESDVANFHGDDLVKTASTGYAMVTAGNAWHESTGFHTVMSSTKDAAFLAQGGGRRAVLQATGGIVDINAGQHIAMGASGVSICAAPGLTYVNPAYGGDWAGATGQSSVAWHARIGAGLADAGFAVLDYVLAFKKNFVKGDDGKRGWKTDEAHVMDAVKWGVDAAKLYVSLGKLKKLYDEDPSRPPSSGGFKVAASGDASIGAAGHASVYGQLTAGLTAGLAASLSSTLTTSVKALVFAGLGGGYTSVKGYRQVKVGSDFGKVSISSDTDTSVAAKGKVTISAQAAGQLNSDTVMAIDGKTKLVFMGGSYGGIATDSDFSLGKFSSKESYAGAAIDSQSVLKFTDSEISAHKGAAGYALRDNKVTLFSNGKAGELLIDGSQIKVDGARICLG